MAGVEPGAIRSTETELEERLQVIRGLYANGMTQAAIVRYIKKELTWDVSDRWIRELCARVWEQQGEDFKRLDRDAFSGWFIALRVQAINRCMASGQFAVARQYILDLENQIAKADTANKNDAIRRELIERGLNPEKILETAKQTLLILDPQGNELENAKAD